MFKKVLSEMGGAVAKNVNIDWIFDYFLFMCSAKEK